MKSRPSAPHHPPPTAWLSTPPHHYHHCLFHAQIIASSPCFKVLKAPSPSRESPDSPAESQSPPQACPSPPPGLTHGGSAASTAHEGQPQATALAAACRPVLKACSATHPSQPEWPPKLSLSVAPVEHRPDWWITGCPCIPRLSISALRRSSCPAIIVLMYVSHHSSPCFPIPTRPSVGLRL